MFTGVGAGGRVDWICVCEMAAWAEGEEVRLCLISTEMGKWMPGKNTWLRMLIRPVRQNSTALLI